MTSSIEERLNNSIEFDLNSNEIKSNDFFLTTFDNFFNPFEDFNSWFAFDSAKSYNSSGLLDRIADVPEGLGEFQERKAVVEAMHRIVRLHDGKIYKIVVRKID